MFRSAIAIIALGLLVQPAFAQQQPSPHGQPWVRSVSVSGTCLRSVQPDRGSITVTADVLDQNLQVAARRSTESYERLKAAIRKLNLKDLELSTSEYSFQEVREWEKDKNVFKGFRARMGLNVSTSDFSRLGEVIAAASKEGIREVSGLATYLSIEKTKVEKEACLEEAVRNARAKAETVARAAGAKLGRVLVVNEDVANVPRPEPMPMFKASRSMVAADAEMAAPTVVAGTQKITIDISVSFALD